MQAGGTRTTNERVGSGNQGGDTPGHDLEDLTQVTVDIHGLQVEFDNGDPGKSTAPVSKSTHMRARANTHARTRATRVFRNGTFQIWPTYSGMFRIFRNLFRNIPENFDLA